MKVLGLASQKGGCGKTTLALNLAVAAQADGLNTIIFDFDAQATATNLYALRIEHGHSEFPRIATVTADSLVPSVEMAKQFKTDLIIFDLAPTLQANSKMLISACDYLLFPTVPSQPDLMSLENSVATAKELNRRCAAVLNRARPRREAVNKEAAELIKTQLGCEVAPQAIVDRVIYEDTLKVGLGVIDAKPKDAASEEIRTLWQWSKKQLLNVKEDA